MEAQTPSGLKDASSWWHSALALTSRLFMLCIPLSSRRRALRYQLRALQRGDPDLLVGRKVDGCLRDAGSIGLIQGVLFRRCYESVEYEVQLRFAVPKVA